MSIKYLVTMNSQIIKYKNKSKSYSVIIGKNILTSISREVKNICPRTKKIALIVDKNVPTKFINILKKKLKVYKPILFYFTANEKTKSIQTVDLFLDKLSSLKLNRTDLLISVGGGITGDITGFVASIFKRGINYINIPTTLLAQVDSAIGGKTGVNSKFGKNLIGSFYQPKLVVSDTQFLKSLPKKEMICGYAEILKHSIIKDQKFFNWLKINSGDIIKKKDKQLSYAIKKSCEIKMSYVNKDVNEQNLRMILNFGHTFAHAIEVKNRYSSKITHGEAVLSGIILAVRLSVVKKICDVKILREIEQIYSENNLNYTYKEFLSSHKIVSLIPFLKNDKKNNDDKINFICLKKIGKTTKPNNFKISTQNLKKYCQFMSQL